MDKSLQSNTDIADEQYKGPSAAITTLGKGAIEHLKWAAIGIVAFGAAALIRPSFASSIITGGREWATRLKVPVASDAGIISKGTSGIKKAIGSTVHFALGEGKGAMGNITVDARHQQWLERAIADKEGGFGHLFTSHTIGNLPFIGKSVKSAMAKGPLPSALTFGGLGGILGYAGGWIVAVLGGHQQANQAKDQFHKAKEEIIRLRSERASPEVTVPEAATPTTKVAQASIDVTPETTVNAAAPQAIAATKKGDNGWADGVTAQKDTKVSAEPAMA